MGPIALAGGGEFVRVVMAVRIDGRNKDVVAFWRKLRRDGSG